MYAQMIKTAGTGVKDRGEMSEEERKFQDRIDAGEPRLERREGVLVLERLGAEARSEPPALGLGRELARGEL